MSGLTVGSLHKLLSKMIEEGHSRKPVSIDKTTFNSPLENHGVTILRTYNIRLESIPVMDDNGIIEKSVDGKDHSKTICVLEGIDFLEE